ncbi:alpha/beta fold hydrolase [Parahaliea mediterranea]|uniref:Alpha/beta hydrolase n=1 Tax=Parahaliea mediterranea TaxID=651086 RepID=A0A939DF74_9GAMM|nr:alpha/beta hydrolase [Parahaliea mediterranea]MBN7797020.1 alpha/beta hydrolase [Parahaliea mediterranea]
MTDNGMQHYDDIHYRGADGLGLYARDYNRAGSSAPVLLCLHGLTRNSADFEGLASELAGDCRLVCADQRGRGRSDYDPNPANYQPATYVADMFALLDHLGLEQVVVIGTSMGGLMGMMMGAMQPARLRALVLNDIGPEVNPAGLARIKDYVGKSAPVATWEEAVAQARAINGREFPDFDHTRWLAFARAIYREQNGVPVLAYDPAIAAPIDAADAAAVPPDLWPLFEALPVPVLVLRGGHSDILLGDCATRMGERGRNCQVVEVSGRGHAPTLEEAAALGAIRALLDAL